MNRESTEYNNMTSILIKDIPVDEREQAVKEWAQGSEAMERFLTRCMEEGIETFGCHPECRPFVQFIPGEDNEKLLRVMKYVLGTNGSRLFFNPNGSGSNILGVPNNKAFGLSEFGVAWPFKEEHIREECEELIDGMTKAIDIPVSDNDVFVEIIKLYKLFEGKATDLSFELAHLEDGKYVFEVVDKNILGERYEEFKDVFSKVGMEEVRDGRTTWSFYGENENDLLEVIRDIREEFEERRPEIPEFITPGMTDVTAFIVKRNQLKNDPNGDEKLDSWVEELRIISNQLIDISTKSADIRRKFSEGEIDEKTYEEQMILVKKLLAAYKREVRDFKSEKGSKSELEESIEDRKAYDNLYAHDVMKVQEMVSYTISGKGGEESEKKSSKSMVED